MTLLSFLFPVILILLVLAFLAGGTLAAGALSHWIDRNRQSLFSLMVWMVALGIGISSLTKPRVIDETFLNNLAMFASGGGRTAMVGHWAAKILTWSTVLLAAAIIASRFIQHQPEKGCTSSDKAPAFLVFGVFSYLFLGGALNAMYGTVPDPSHRLIYPFLLFGTALTLPGSGYKQTAATIRYALATLCVASLLMAIAMPNQVLQTGYKGLIPGFNYRLWGAMPHANALGGAALIYLLIERLAPWRSNSLRRISWLMVFITLLLTQSKTNWLIGIALLGFWFGFQVLRALNSGTTNPRRKEFVALAMGALLFVTAAGFMALIVVGPEILFAKIFSTLESAGATTLTGRVVLWQLALNEWWENPLFGYGPTLWDEDYRLAVGLSFAHHAHNQYINTLGSAGLFGIAGLAIILFAYLYYALRFFGATSGVLLAVLAVIAVRGLTETPMSVWGVLSQETLINLALVALMTQIARSAPSTSAQPRMSMYAT